MFTIAIILSLSFLATGESGFQRNKRQLGFCSDNTEVIARAINGNCGGGFRYDAPTGNCCRPTSLPTCPGGGNAIALCINNRCGNTLTCQQTTFGGRTISVCCGTTTAATCASPNVFIGPCLTGNVCPTNYRCVTNQCCGPAQASPLGPFL